MGFDFSYRGNHNQLIAERSASAPPWSGWRRSLGATIINNEPSSTFALDDECRIQCRFNIEARTNAYQIRTNEFQEEQLSVYVTARQYWQPAAEPDLRVDARQAVERLLRWSTTMWSTRCSGSCADDCVGLIG